MFIPFYFYLTYILVFQTQPAEKFSITRVRAPKILVFLGGMERLRGSLRAALIAFDASQVPILLHAPTMTGQEYL